MLLLEIYNLWLHFSQIQDKEGDEIVGHKTQVKVVKNKLAPPMKTANFEVYYTDYNTLFSELVDLGVEAGYGFPSVADRSF